MVHLFSILLNNIYHFRPKPSHMLSRQKIYVVLNFEMIKLVSDSHEKKRFAKNRHLAQLIGRQEHGCRFTTGRQRHDKVTRQTTP